MHTYAITVTLAHGKIGDPYTTRCHTVEAFSPQDALQRVQKAYSARAHLYRQIIYGQPTRVIPLTLF